MKSDCKHLTVHITASSMPPSSFQITKRTFFAASVSAIASAQSSFRIRLRCMLAVLPILLSVLTDTAEKVDVAEHYRKD